MNRPLDLQKKELRKILKEKGTLLIRIPAVPVILPFLKPSPPGMYTKKLKLFSVL